MSLIKNIKQKIQAHHENHCGCGGHNHEHGVSQKPKDNITKDMVVREVAERWPQTVSVFGKHKVDFCCGGAHSIEQTARARGCRDIDALVADLNRAVH